MPKVRPLTREGKVKEEVKQQAICMKHELQDSHITYSQIAEVLGLTPQAVSTQFRNDKITFEVWMTATMLLRGDI